MKTLSLIAFFLLVITAPAFAASDDIVGTILEVEGAATVTVPGNPPAPAAVTMAVHPGDVIETGAGARVYMQLIDNTELTLGENGRMTIDDYNFDPSSSAENSATYSIVKGAFLYVSGLIAKRPDPQVTVNVPVGSIGIRGTKFWGGEVSGTYDVIVGDGEVELNTGGGKVRLKKGQGTSVKARGAAPAPAKAWPQDRINKAVATVALKNPGKVGERMKRNAERNEMLRLMHREKIIERKLMKEEGIKPEDAKKPEARERLKRLQEEKARRMSGLPDLPAAEKPAAVKSIIRSEKPVRATVETTVDTTRTLTDDAKRTLNSVTETTTTVIEKTDGTVQTTVEKVTDTVDKPVTDTTDIVKDTAKDTAAPVRDTAKDTGRVLKTLKQKQP